MKSWPAAGDRLRERRFSDMATEASQGAAYAYDFVSYRSALPSFIESILADNDSLLEEIVEFSEKRGAYVSESLTAITKFYHVLACACVSMDRGALTWSTVDGYHASLFGARAILAIYGVVPYAAGGRTVLIDLWPEYGRPDQTKEFRKKHGRSLDLIRLLAPKKPMSQGDLWALLKRVSNIADKGDVDQQERLRHLREVVDQKPWQSRHATMYDSGSWTWPDDIEFLTVSKADKSAMLLADDQSVSSLMELLDLQFEFLGMMEGRLRGLTSLPGLQIPAFIQAARTPLVMCNW